MTDNQFLYWLKINGKCPACGGKTEKTGKSIKFGAFNTVQIPIYKCGSCGTNYVEYQKTEYVHKLSVRLKNAGRKDYIRLKYLDVEDDIIIETREQELETERILFSQKAYAGREVDIIRELANDEEGNTETEKTDGIAIHDREIYDKAVEILHSSYGENASFRPGQYEAIENTLLKNRTLVVQKTGWGKSLVYFIATKILRDQGKGITLVISPLLALMENQEEAAKKVGLRCASLNSTVDDKQHIYRKMANDELDLVLITPETLFAADTNSIIKNIRVGLLVIDEAHCISDWGHDFRLEYCRLKTFIKGQFSNVPVLATTATANNRVVEDLMEQLGGKTYESRGPLMRENLFIQVLNLPNKAERMAWMKDNIPKLQGSGIVYCLTRKDCEYVSEFLNANGISSLPYYSKSVKEDLENRVALRKFKNNEIKVLVATVKLGMGFDKGDIAFIVHYQMPKDVVSYYQQIGRAGRNIEKAYTFLMIGQEDRKIHEYFIAKAFPTEDEMRKVLSIIKDCAEIGPVQLQSRINIDSSRRDKTLAFLVNEGYIYKTANNKFSPAPKRGEFVYNAEHYDELRSIRRREMGKMLELADTKTCLNRFVIDLLNDKTKGDCGFCANCCGEYLPGKPGEKSVEDANVYLERQIFPIDPRKRWPDTSFTGEFFISHKNVPGLCLSIYGEPVYGELVKQGKYSGQNRFDDKLVEKSADVLKNVIEENGIEYITCVPSKKSNIVEDFTERLAKKTGLNFMKLLEKDDTKQQKSMENNYFQCRNAFYSFKLKSVAIPDKIILVDDIVDSKWTLTVCGYRLGEGGCRWVFPFALAESSKEE